MAIGIGAALLGSAIIGGVAGTGSAMMASRSAGKAQKGQEAANAMNYAIMREQMAFQREGMQKKHQWEVADLKAAGLNPILSAMGTPPIAKGASAVMESTKKQSSQMRYGIQKLVADIAQSGMAAHKLYQDSREAKARADMAAQDAKAYTDPKYGPYLSGMRAVMRSGFGAVAGAAAGGYGARGMLGKLGGLRKIKSKSNYIKMRRKY